LFQIYVYIKRKRKTRLNILQRPGYGLSTPCTNGSNEFTFSSSILEAANIVYGDNIHVILGGHDRGARTMHRAAVSINQFPKVNALGVFLADIVPIVEEYASFSNPNYTVGYFHWVGLRTLFLRRNNLQIVSS
jgi:haloacetate dehalogenase